MLNKKRTLIYAIVFFIIGFASLIVCFICPIIIGHRLLPRGWHMLLILICAASFICCAVMAGKFLLTIMRSRKRSASAFKYTPPRNHFDKCKFDEWLLSFEHLTKLGVQLERTQDKTFSKFGGMPTVPKDFKYPTAYNWVTDTDEPIPFLLQIDFSEINPRGELTDFPTEGLLYVFIDNENYDYKILFFDKPYDLTPADKPDALDIVCKEFNVYAKSVKTYPDPDDSEQTEELCGKEPFVGASESYAEYQKEHLDKTVLGGWPAHAQEGGFINKLKEKNGDEWVLLLQIESIDEDENFTWGDAGTLYFYISKQDLKLRKFDNIQLDVENY